jgi:hypothetical protein
VTGALEGDDQDSTAETSAGAARDLAAGADPGGTREPEADAGSERAPDPALLLRVTEGNPTPEELAAVVSVLAARLSTVTATGPTTARSEWGAPARKLRGIHRHSPGAWRASAWPR